MSLESAQRQVTYSVAFTWKSGNVQLAETNVSYSTAITAYTAHCQNPAVESVRMYKNVTETTIEAEWNK